MTKRSHNRPKSCPARQTARPHPAFALNYAAAAQMALVLGLTVGTTTFVAPAALAQAAGEIAEVRRNFNIPAGPLNMRLDTFAAAAGIELNVGANLVRGENAQGLSGNYSVSEGLAELLRGQGLQATRETSGRYALSQMVQQTQSQTAEGIATLPPVTVHGKAGSAIYAYSGEQVTSGSRVGLLGDKDFMETPFSIIAYTNKYIADRQAQNIADVIAVTDPTVFSNNISGAWSENYSIRGLSSSTTDMMFNGLFGMAPYYRASPEMFERIEVLKGPSALLNGMPPGSSVGGTVNLVPKRASNDPLTRLTVTYMSDSQFGGHVDLGRRFGENKQFGIRFNGVYRDGEGAVNQQEKRAQLASLGLDWHGRNTRLFVDLYDSDDRVDGVIRGIGLAPGVTVPKPPKADTLLNPDWSLVHNQDKGVMVRGEFDVSDQLMAYAAFGASKSSYKYNGAITSQVLNTAGDFRTIIGQLAFDVKKLSAEVGLKGKFQTGVIKHHWALNATHYSDTVREYGRRSVLNRPGF